MKMLTLEQLIKLSLREDIGCCDVTTQSLIHPRLQIQADIVCRQPGVFCGVNIIKTIFSLVDKKVTVRPIVRDGDTLKANEIAVHLYGSAKSILVAERVMLNFITHLSAIATTTAKYVKAIKPYHALILDTRKTMPLWRSLQRYAVICGGGSNHRFDLSSMGMIKDNHRLLLEKGIDFKQAIRTIKSKYHVPVELEIDDLGDLRAALESEADIILLDNMSPSEVKTAILKRRQWGYSTVFEASGGITLENVKKYAATGVERISIGAITHSAQHLDIGLDIAYKV
jgi:nicotinate-nucleotide pyrophosphorylase (carboxylating)